MIAPKHAILHISKWMGLFGLSRLLTRQDLRILCFHGAALADESSFRPGLFTTAAKFEARLAYLVKRGYPVIPLDEALAGRHNGGLPANATVITIDDGWYGTYRLMVPLLQQYNLPATLYIASYYLQKQTQVFNVAVDYAIWRAGQRILNVADVDPAMNGQFDLALPADRSKAADCIVRYGESAIGAEARQALFTSLCRALGLDSSMITERRLIAYMSEKEAEKLPQFGIDIQLHTHRHRFPRSLEAATREIEDNREALARLSSGRLVHFCYPSGEYSPEQIPWLQSMGIESATTTDRGINRRSQSPYELLRILDSEAMTTIEFEAEVCGFLDLLRRFRRGRSH